MIVFGGNDSTGTENDVRALSLSEGTNVDATAARRHALLPGRWIHSAVYDPWATG